MVREKLQLFIETAEWRKTNYIQPHEYIVQKNCPELFAALAESLENDKGVYSGTFKGCEYHYLVIGNYKYWRIEDIVNRQLLLSETEVTVRKNLPVR